MGAVSSRAQLLAPGLKEAVQGKFLSLQALFSLFWSFFLLFSFYYFIYCFVIPTSPPPSCSSFSLSVRQRASICVSGLASLTVPLSVSRMKTRWTSSSHCYLPADSGKLPFIPPSLAWQKYLPLFREACICRSTSSLSCNISGKLFSLLLLRLVEVSRLCN